MKVEIYHASKYGNGARVAEEAMRLLQVRGNEVNVHHMDDVSPKDVPRADLYIFGSPTHMGKAPGGVVRFLGKFDLPPGTRYALFMTCSAARPDKKTGAIPSEEELDRKRRTLRMMDEPLVAKGMRKVAEAKVYVQPENMRGPLEPGWENIVNGFVARILNEK